MRYLLCSQTSKELAAVHDGPCFSKEDAIYLCTYLHTSQGFRARSCRPRNVCAATDVVKRWEYGDGSKGDPTVGASSR